MDSRQVENQADMYRRATAIHGALLLPSCELSLRPGSTTKTFDVYDGLRRKWVALTPEEWVRQHFVSYMFGVLGYPPHYTANEVGLRLNGMSRRADTVVYDTALHPLLIVEYKAPTIRLTEAAVRQALLYDLTLNSRAVMVTNGLDVYTFRNNSIRRGVLDYSTLLSSD